MFSRLKYLDLYCCLAKATGLWCFVVSQPIIKLRNFKDNFLLKKFPLAAKKYFVDP